jgi:ATP-dependent Clp protease protease subunit
MLNLLEVDPRIKERGEDLLDLPVIITINKFNEQAVSDFAEDLNEALATGQDIIPVHIDSYGGQCYSLMSMITLFENSPKPIATIITGKAMSCGAILFSMGSAGHRYMSPHARLMIHDVSSGSFGKVNDLKTDSREAEFLNDHGYKLMAKNCGQPENYFLDLVHKNAHADWYLGPKDAKKHRLASHIKVPKFTTKVRVDSKFE